MVYLPIHLSFQQRSSISSCNYNMLVYRLKQIGYYCSGEGLNGQCLQFLFDFDYWYLGSLNHPVYYLGRMCILHWSSYIQNATSGVWIAVASTETLANRQDTLPLHGPLVWQLAKSAGLTSYSHLWTRISLPILSSGASVRCELPPPTHLAAQTNQPK